MNRKCRIKGGIVNLGETVRASRENDGIVGRCEGFEIVKGKLIKIGIGRGK
jgi:hypothetical protein